MNKPIHRYFAPLATATRKEHDEHGVIACASLTAGFHASGMVPDQLAFDPALMDAHITDTPHVWTAEMTQHYISGVPTDWTRNVIDDVEDPYWGAMDSADVSDAIAARGFEAKFSFLMHLRQIRPGITVLGHNPVRILDPNKPKARAIAEAYCNLLDALCPALYVPRLISKRAAAREYQIRLMDEVLAMADRLMKPVYPVVWTWAHAAGIMDDVTMLDMVQRATIPGVDGAVIYHGYTSWIPDGQPTTAANVEADNKLLNWLVDALS